MWTGGKPPRIPVVVSPSPKQNGKTTAFSSNAQVQSKNIDAELQALKQRGLAKILNKHFTETTARLAAEKAAADAACKDLEERKARTSEFQVSGNTELSPLDAMCVKANQWRAETRRKERETMLLYQRYVHKFGDTGVCDLNPQNQQWVPSATPDSSKTAAPPPRSPPKLVPSELVPNMAQQIEATLEEYLQQGALSMPSMLLVGKDQTFQDIYEKEEAEFRNYYRRKLEERGADVKHAGFKITERPNFPGYIVPPDDVDPFQRSVKEDIWKDRIEAAVLAAEAALPIGTIHENEDNDLCSVVSGLTTLHSAMTREVLHECERSVAEFLREEQNHIRQIMEEDTSTSDTGSNMGYTVGDVSLRATEEAENMARQMQAILNEYQNQNGNSKKMSAAATLLTATSKPEPRVFETGNPNESWMVYYDEFYQQEYYHEKNSNRTQWEPPTGTSTDSCSTDFSHELVMPEGARSSDRIAAYRRKRRKVRRRKLVVLMLLTLVFGAASIGYFFLLQQPHVADGTVAPLVALQNMIVDQYEEWTGLAEIKRKEAAAQKLAEEQEALRRRQQQEEEEEKERCRLAEEAAAREVAEEEKVVAHRPWACNLPLAYLFHWRCRQLATQMPVFDLYGLIQSMLQ